MTLKEHYLKDVAPALGKEFGIENRFAIPSVRSVTISVGLSVNQKDAKFAEVAEGTLTRITGQKPVKNKAKKSIASFKIRQGMVVGLSVTLRGTRMWDFLDKLVNVTFARVRDFRGITSTSVDARGNLSVGFREFLPFPEIRPDEVERLHGVEVAIASSAADRAKGVALFKALGFPFKK